MKALDNKPFAEVIESSLQGFLAQSWEWNRFPQFGSMVTVTTESRTLCGVVHQVQTGSMDPVRYPFAYKKTEAELMAEQPHIFEFLKTTFRVLIIGYKEKSYFFYLSPPEPAKIHAFICPMEQQLAHDFFSNNNYLSSLFSSQAELFNLDELILALIKYQRAINILDKKELMQTIGNLRLLIGNDYRRMKILLQRVNSVCML